MDGPVASAKTDGSPCQHDETSLEGQISGYSGTRLSEEIWRHIHSLMPIRDAAQLACVARAFLRSWRCHPNLEFTEESLGLTDDDLSENEETLRDIIRSRVDQILQNHSGIGVKKLKFEVDPLYEKQVFSHHDLDRWLWNTVKPGIEELNLCLDQCDPMYNFQCSLLPDEIGYSLQYLELICCDLRPTSSLGCLRSLTRLELTTVSIAENELEFLLSKCPALERFELIQCSGIVHLKIPCLQKLCYLEVSTCIGLQELEIKAPNVSSVCFDLPLRLSLPESSRIKKCDISFSGAVFYAQTSLPSSMPNLETLTISSLVQTVSTPIMSSKFLHLKFLSIVIGRQDYDYFSLLSFFDAASSLETFILTVFLVGMKCVTIFEDPSDLRQMPEKHYDNLKRVVIINFSCARSLVELTSQIAKSASSLESLTLDSAYAAVRCSVNKDDRCTRMDRYKLDEARRGVLAAQKYIKPKVSSKVEFNIVEPCRRCHAV